MEIYGCRFQSAAWMGWVKALPDELIRTRPVLSAQFASALLLNGDVEESEIRLRDAERWLDLEGSKNARKDAGAREIVVVDEEQYRKLPAKIVRARAQIAETRGDFSGAVKYAEKALRLTPGEDLFEQAQATVVLGFIFWANGDLGHF